MTVNASPFNLPVGVRLGCQQVPRRAEPSRAEPSRAEPSRAEPSRAEPSRAEPSRAAGLCAPSEAERLLADEHDASAIQEEALGKHTACLDAAPRVSVDLSGASHCEGRLPSSGARQNRAAYPSNKLRSAQLGTVNADRNMGHGIARVSAERTTSGDSRCSGPGIECALGDTAATGMLKGLLGCTEQRHQRLDCRHVSTRMCRALSWLRAAR